jgi:hypothetical protein
MNQKPLLWAKVGKVLEYYTRIWVDFLSVSVLWACHSSSIEHFPFWCWALWLIGSLRAVAAAVAGWGRELDRYWVRLVFCKKRCV